MWNEIVPENVKKSFYHKFKRALNNFLWQNMNNILI